MSMDMNLAQVQAWLTQAGIASVLHGAPATRLARVHTDSRSLQAGDFFVALQGERYDANDFLPQARAAGAAAALCHGGLQAAGLAGLEVSDSLRALGALARAWRRQFALPLIAVTGSNGKTTVTQMLAAILQAHAGAAALATQGNLNNEIGLPQTLLRLRAAHRIAVVELGMNHPGEIARLAAVAQPSVALVNNAQREHQEFMHSVEAVARENGAVIEALDAHGVAVFPADDAYSALWRGLAGARRCLSFALHDAAPDAVASAEVRSLACHWQQGAWAVQAQTPAGRLDFALRVAGRHNVKNALAATACALAAGVPLAAVAQGLQAFEPVKGRSRAIALCLDGRALTLVDDSYNANPDSVRAAIDVLSELPAPQALVLGDMGEVGTRGPEFHAEIGAYARARGIARLWCLGAQSAHSVQAYGADAADAQARHCADLDRLQQGLLASLPALGSVLVKGSRFMKMERVVQALTDRATSQGERPCC